MKSEFDMLFETEVLTQKKYKPRFPFSKDFITALQDEFKFQTEKGVKPKRFYDALEYYLIDIKNKLKIASKTMPETSLGEVEQEAGKLQKRFNKPTQNYEPSPEANQVIRNMSGAMKGLSTLKKGTSQKFPTIPAGKRGRHSGTIIPKSVKQQVGKLRRA